MEPRTRAWKVAVALLLVTLFLVFALPQIGRDDYTVLRVPLERRDAPLHPAKGAWRRQSQRMPHFVAHLYENSTSRLASDLPLHGGISSIGEYYARIYLGNQPFRVQVDTGSSTLAVPMAKCVHCHPGDLRYSPAASPYFPGMAHAVPCNATSRGICTPNTCSRFGCSTCDRQTRACCSKVDPSSCGFSLLYGDGSGAQGALRVDMMTWVPSVDDSPPLAAPTYFGGIYADSDDFEQDEVDGILGMGYPVLACNPSCVEPAFDSLVRHNAIRDIFAFCVREQGGRMSLGGVDSAMMASQVEYADLRLSRPPSFYTVELGGRIAVGDASVRLPNWNLGIVDSGTTLVVVSTAAFASIASAVKNHASGGLCAQVPGLCERAKKTWFRPAGCTILTEKHLDLFPPISFFVGSPRNPVRLELAARDYLVPLRTVDAKKTPYRCVGFMTMDSLSGGIDVILGNTIMMRYATVYDRSRSRVGFGVRTDDCGGELEDTVLGNATIPRASASPSWGGDVLGIVLILSLVLVAVCIANLGNPSNSRGERVPLL